MPSDRFKSRLIRPLLCAGAILSGAALGTQSLGQAGAATIVERSPFLPANFNPPAERMNSRPTPATAQRQDYEFRGVYELDGGYQVLISEAKSRSGRWMPVGGSDETIQIQDYDVQTETVKVLINGEPRELQLASIEANPQPVAVARAASNLPQRSVATPSRTTSGVTPVRRTIRPSAARIAPATSESQTPSAQDGSGSPAAPPPPAWLQELRERAAERREAVAEQQTQ